MARSSTVTYPIGVFDTHEPSFLAPPTPGAMPGYARVYVDDFVPHLLSSMWVRFSGTPKGDPAGRFEVSHVQVADGMLEIGTWRDKRHHDVWASGGTCLCGQHTTYGAYFVRSRQTGVGPDDAELLWPKDNSWPPELDFAESGISKDLISWFDHFAPTPSAYHYTERLDVEHWHTWGIVWTPTSVTFVVDGKAWGTEVLHPDGIPSIPMTLDLESETWCGVYPECPKSPSELLIDWVAIYHRT